MHKWTPFLVTALGVLAAIMLETTLGKFVNPFFNPLKLSI